MPCSWNKEPSFARAGNCFQCILTGGCGQDMVPREALVPWLLPELRCGEAARRWGPH